LLDKIQKISIKKHMDKVVEGLNDQYRICPEDEVLEKKRKVAGEGRWVPVLPAPPVKGPDGVSWPEWAFSMCLHTFLNPHRSENETCQILRRFAAWGTMYQDFLTFMHACQPCQKVRAKPLKGKCGVSRRKSRCERRFRGQT
jgi:hypothetical protein